MSLIKKNINVIVATSLDYIIGRDYEMPWYLPKDLKRFKAITMGHTVIMGRKCWESIPVQYRPLSGRKNIIISRNTLYDAPGAMVYNDLDVAINDCSTDEQIFIIGGGEIYKQAFKYAATLYLTRVNTIENNGVMLDGMFDIYWKLCGPMEIMQDGEHITTFMKLIRTDDTFNLTQL